MKTRRGEEKTFSIVGVDEIDLERGHISWVSPLARAVLGHRLGDVVVVKAPQGENELEIIDLSYRGFDQLSPDPGDYGRKITCSGLSAGLMICLSVLVAPLKCR